MTRRFPARTLAAVALSLSLVPAEAEARGLFGGGLLIGLIAGGMVAGAAASSQNAHPHRYRHQPPPRRIAEPAARAESSRRAHAVEKPRRPAKVAEQAIAVPRTAPKADKRSRQTVAERRALRVPAPVAPVAPVKPLVASAVVPVIAATPQVIEPLRPAPQPAAPAMPAAAAVIAPAIPEPTPASMPVPLPSPPASAEAVPASAPLIAVQPEAAAETAIILDVRAPVPVFAPQEPIAEAIAAVAIGAHSEPPADAGDTPAPLVLMSAAVIAAEPPAPKPGVIDSLRAGLSEGLAWIMATSAKLWTARAQAEPPATPPAAPATGATDQRLKKLLSEHKTTAKPVFDVPLPKPAP